MICFKMIETGVMSFFFLVSQTQKLLQADDHTWFAVVVTEFSNIGLGYALNVPAEPVVEGLTIFSNLT